MRIIVLYDNVARPPFREGWGFSALIEFGNRKILFDAGADRLTLAHNVQALKVDLSQLTDVFVSHAHCDHVGGLSYVLEKAREVHVWAPEGMARYLKPRIRGTKAEMSLAPEPFPMGEGLMTTGTMGRAVREHGLIVVDKEKAVLITGCAHPGIDRMAERAGQIVGRKLALVLGGFHLEKATSSKLVLIADRLEKLAEAVAPGHCTGEKAASFLLARFPQGFALEVGKEYLVQSFHKEGR